MVDVSGITRSGRTGFSNYSVARGMSQGVLPAWLAGILEVVVEWHGGQAKDVESKTSQLKKLAASAVGERNFSTAT
jgi:hypothetical protein